MPFRLAAGTPCACKPAKMPPIIRLWLTTIALSGLLMLIPERLDSADDSPVYGRLAFAALVFACLLLIMRRWWHNAVESRLEPLVRALSTIQADGADYQPPGHDPISKLEDLIGRMESQPGAADRKVGCALDSAAGATEAGRQMGGNVRLAADHVESISALLLVSQTHRQPIPRTAFQNLELVSKNLRAIERQLSGNSQPTLPEDAFSSSEDSPAVPVLPRPEPRLSFECRISPSGKSTPCG